MGDPAYIDVLYWFEQKRLRQAVIITREKGNMKPTVIAHHPFDRLDPVNRGVEEDGMAGYTYAYLRRIVYCDPASGERFVFLTTDNALRPGLVALLYLLRWKIEKSFDVFKNKLHQQKAWANGETAARTQAHLTALTHNLLILLLATLEQAGLREEKVERQQDARRAAQPKNLRVPAQEMVRHASQITCQFIRLLRHYLVHKTPGATPCPYSNAAWRYICSAFPDTHALPLVESESRWVVVPPKPRRTESTASSRRRRDRRFASSSEVQA